ncbi:MAG TPA: 3-deoxy-8-phosphooctulonate synthase [Gemmatales bacterium]|nr:3-deoxy-8-phosphooctulonate synthase [Gemmatales bacterium]
MPVNTVKVDASRAAGEGLPLLWIAGPCVIESREFLLPIADQLAQMSADLGIPLVFKSSFDKANRSSGKSFRGPGMKAGLAILDEVKKRTGLPVLTDFHESWQAEHVAQVCDILQVPAFLARQTDMLEAAGKTGRVVNVKKGQFMAPSDMKNVVHKLQETGCQRILLTERGSTFGYHTLVTDFRGIPQMQEYGFPVIFDATHSVQSPGGAGDRSGGDRRMVPYLTKAAVAVGANGIFLEVHPNPDQAPSDGPNMLPLSAFPELVKTCLRLRAALTS